VFCIYLIVHYNSYHNAVASSYINQFTGKINERYNNYFQLRKTNDSLVKANEHLYNELKSDFLLPDTTAKAVIDTIHVDSLESFRKYNYMQAKVVSNSVSQQANFIELARGTRFGVKKDIGVVDPNNNIVGIVTDVSDNYSVVMSLLHKDSKISAKLKNGGDAGMVVWDGKDPNILTLTDIRKSARVAKGDTVFTSGFTPTFPYGLMIGTVLEVIQDKSSNNLIIKLKSSANFYNLQYVYVIDNLDKDEMDKLMDKVKKQNQ